LIRLRSGEMTRDDVLTALRSVHDPEIPTISVVDMGIITRVDVSSENDVQVSMTPTFVGCPAIAVMQNDVTAAIQALGPKSLSVDVNFDVPWSTNLLTEKGRAALLKHGLAPPEIHEVEFSLDVLNNTACPFCGSHNTILRSPFGPTLCRSLHYCNACRQGFEGFKPV